MKGKIFWGTILLLIISVNQLLAQGCTPGDADYDPDDCPLDTWVLILVAAALIYATWQLYRRQKAQQAI